MSTGAPEEPAKPFDQEQPMPLPDEAPPAPAAPAGEPAPGPDTEEHDTLEENDDDGPEE
jgi:hypothetical protein